MHGPKLNTVRLTAAESAAIVQSLAELEVSGPTGAAHYLFTETGESVNDNWLVKLIRKIEKLNERATN
tara:strand:+ start:406 stop:609 length:204 start_codon:yes stop_codon:yes gene_type:complete